MCYKNVHIYCDYALITFRSNCTFGENIELDTNSLFHIDIYFSIAVLFFPPNSYFSRKEIIQLPKTNPNYIWKLSFSLVT